MASKVFRNGVFISYSHKDKAWLERLQTILKPLIRNETIKLWDDTNIAVGAEWSKEIQKSIALSRVAILLVSPDFLASDFIASQELPRILTNHEKKGLVIFWIAVSASPYHHTDLAKFQAANDPKRPLDMLKKAERNKALVDIADKIVSAVEVNVVANVLSIVDDFAPQAEAFVSGKKEPTKPVQHRVMARQQHDVILIEERGQTIEVIKAADLELLDKNSRQFIRVHEFAMKELFDRWTELYPKRISPDSHTKHEARLQSEGIRQDLCSELNQILDYLKFLRKNLNDHYSHVRFICQK